MTRVALVVMTVVALGACAPTARTMVDAGPPPSCAFRTEPDGGTHFVVDPATRLPTEDFVWGAADLHAHPAGHLALGGHDDGTSGVLWGRPDTDHEGTVRQDHGRIWIGPRDSCDGETHLRATPDVAARLTQSLVFSIVGDEGHRAHSAMFARAPGTTLGAVPSATSTGTSTSCAAPVGDTGLAEIDAASRTDAALADAGVPSLTDGSVSLDPPDPSSPFAAWPHAQDLYHQQMYVEMLRRAWEGGLRLMFASIQENQSLATIMGISVAPGPLVLDPARDEASVERQIAFIERMVSEHSDFLRIVSTPREARDAIRDGMLALVLSVEIDWLPLDVVQRLHDDHGVIHIVPIHLADNPVGGTAAYTPVFNMHSALFQRALGAPELRYFSMTRDECIGRRAGPPLSPSYEIGLLFLPAEMGAREYFDLGYESCDVCAPSSPRRVDVSGSRNATGITHMSHIRALMRMGMLVDVVHMSIASATDVITEAERWGYPVLDTHTGISVAGGRVAQDRELPLALARRIYRNQSGMVGMGTGPQGAVLRQLYRAEGAPLATLAAGVTTALPAVPARPAQPCTEEILAALPVDARVCVGASSCDGRLGAIRVRTCDGAAQDLDLTQGCTAPLDRAAALGVELISYQPTRESWCATDIETECPSVPGVTLVNRADVSADTRLVDARIVQGDTVLCAFEMPALPAGATSRPGTALATGRCAPRTETCFGDEGLPRGVPSRAPAVVPGRRVLRVRGVPFGDFDNRVRGSSAFYSGADVVVHLVFADATNVDVSLNHRGLWAGSSEYAEYRVIATTAELSSVSISLSADDPRAYGWSIASLVVEEIEDPLLAWARSYDTAREQIARPGATTPEIGPVVMAIGTDQNGFAAQLPTTSVALDAQGCEPFEVCSTETNECTPLRMIDRGIANYAMLGDFFSALGTADRLLGHDAAHSVQGAVFSSADAVIRTWEHAETRAASVPP